MMAARRSHAVAVLNGKLYAVGGESEDRRPLSSVERYAPGTNAWEAVGPMAAARVAHAVAVLDDKVYSVGGAGDDGHLSSVERYDPVTNAWEAMAPTATARICHAVAVLEGKLYASTPTTVTSSPRWSGTTRL